jgi:D-alanyl-lipoteichoic acid acyltransferase DltB (MBOAT superfamily)
MIFNSVTYLLFLLIVVALYWLLPRRPRLWMIFISSLVFYGFWKVEFLPVMLLSVVTDYFVALRMPRARRLSGRRKLLAVSLIVNMALLFYFKYLLFFAENAYGLMHLVGMEPDPLVLYIILPLGISFYTFQTISYTVDVYRGIIKPERDFVLYSCYVTFFPQLVAGPILRAVEVIPQLSERPRFKLEDLVWGIKRILYGLFLKVVLADNISPLVDSGFAVAPSSLSAIDVWTLAFLFGFQIYFDFSAYSHIALGSARLMGIKFPENFNFPYVAASPRDFWKRWHISLSSWIRDYLYLPLTGSAYHDRSTGGLDEAVENSSARRRNKALLITWVLMGLWHGANWTFLLWGLYHAIFIVIFRLVASLVRLSNQRLAHALGMLITLPVIMLGWIPFRAQSLPDVFILYGKLFQPSMYMSLGMRVNVYLVTAIVLVGFFMVYFARNTLLPALRKNSLVRVPAESLVFGAMITLIFIYLRPISQFIYFQF